MASIPLAIDPMASFHPRHFRVAQEAPELVFMLFLPDQSCPHWQQCGIVIRTEEDNFVVSQPGTRIEWHFIAMNRGIVINALPPKG